MGASASKGRSGNRWLVLVVLALGLFITLLDLTIVNIAIPRIIDGVNASLDEVLWVLNAYSLLYAVLLITSGRLGDIFGPKNLFVLGVAVFTVASAFSGLAQDAAQLIAARAAQGLGAALLAPQGLPLMTSLFPPGRRGAVFAVYGIVSGLAVVAGPTLGGLLVTHLGWRWIFFVNLPVGAAIIALALILVPDLRPGRRHRLDIPGVLLATAGLFGVVFGLIEGQRYAWGKVTSFITIPEVIGSGVALLLAFVAYQKFRQNREPLVPFAVFGDRNFTLMTLVLAAMGFAILGVYLPLTIYFQSVLGYSALKAGLTLAPQPLAMMFVAPFAGGLADRYGGKYVLLFGLPLFAAGVGYIDWAAHADSARWSFLPGLISSGIGLACVWGPVYSVATRNLRPELAGVAGGVLNTIQELGAVAASAAVGAFLQNRLATALRAEAASRSAELPRPLRERFVEGFGHTAKGGLDVGAGQTGSGNLPEGLPGQTARQLEQLAHSVFAHGFVDAMHPTMLLPVAIVLAAALGCFAVKNPPRKGSQSVGRTERVTA